MLPVQIVSKLRYSTSGLLASTTTAGNTRLDESASTLVLVRQAASNQFVVPFVFLTACVIFAVLDYTEEGRSVARVVRVFEKGYVPSNFKAVDDASDLRVLLDHDLRAMLRPMAINSFKVLLGERGMGKSTAIRKAARNVGESVNGVVVIMVPGIDFAKELETRLNVEDSSIVGTLVRVVHKFVNTADATKTTPGEPQSTWDRIAPVIEKAAEVFKARHGRPMTLVIDDLNVFGTSDFVITLQNFAAKHAKSNDLHVVFVSSDKVALSIMQGNRDSWNGVSDCSFHFPELDDKDAIAYIRKRHDMPIGLAGTLVQTVTGGRYSDLNHALMKLRAGVAVEEIRREYDTILGETLNTRRLDATHPFFIKLASSEDGVPRDDDSVKSFGIDNMQFLLDSNIIAMRSNQTYVLQGQHRVCFFQRKSAEAAAARITWAPFSTPPNSSSTLPSSLQSSSKEMATQTSWASARYILPLGFVACGFVFGAWARVISQRRS